MRNLSFSIWWISESGHFQWKLSFYLGISFRVWVLRVFFRLSRRKTSALVKTTIFDMTHSRVRNVFFYEKGATWLIYVLDMTDSHEAVDALRYHSVRHVSFIRVTWHVSFIRVTCLIHTCDMSHTNSFDMTHSHVRRDSFFLQESESEVKKV